MSTVAPVRATEASGEDRAHISRVPYLPGLDGMRALAVVAVVVYHANVDWLPGGFLGVEMFFVISGYLITLLLISERERTYRISLRRFWMRRARRLLPALYTMMLMVTVWTALFERDALGQLRGAVLAGFFYVSNWYQIWVGLGYTAAGDFAPLRHLWSLAVEEQFYLFWPVVMVVLLGRAGTRRVANVSRWLFAATIVIGVLVAVLYYSGPIGPPDVTPQAYWWIGSRPISKIDTLYLSTFTRLGGLMLGSAFAMVWRPFAIVRGPLRNKGHLFDVAAVAALIVLAWSCWRMYLVDPAGADALLFRGGWFIVGLATVALIAAVSHRGALANRVLGNRVLLWIGTRSYGLYLYHWPVFQMIRHVAGNKLTVGEFAYAMVITCAITEVSYRLIETPIRTGTFLAGLRRIRRQARRGPKLIVAGGVAAVSAVALFAGATLATAHLQQNDIAQALDAGEQFTTDLSDVDHVPTRSTTESVASTTVPPTTVDSGAAPGSTPVGQSTVPGGVVAATDPSTVSPTISPTVSPTISPTVSPSMAAPTTIATTTAPPTTSPPTTAPPTTVPAPVKATQLGVVTDVSNLPPLDIPPTATGYRLVALGDSVMLGAAEELQAQGFQVDAKQSRQMKDFVPTMQMLHDNGTFGSVVVIHLGTNGGFSQDTLDRMLATVADVPVVILLTGKADRSWIAGNNEKLRAVPATHPNVTVLDWEALAGGCQGHCFYKDGIHLTQSGQNYYAGLIATLLAQP